LLHTYSSSFVACGWSEASEPLYASSLVMLPNGQLLAAHPQLPLVALLQSSERYVAISAPSTPILLVNAFTSNVPCAGVSRKPLHAYAAAPRTTTAAAAPSTSRDLSDVFIVPGPLP